MKGIQGTSNKTYRQLMGNGLHYEIPKFQRDYTWEVEQWDDLWEDMKALLSREEEEHYMGYLVLQTSNNKNFQVIDGQQRLTTLSLIILATLKCLKDLIEDGIDADNNAKRKENLLNSYIGYVDPVTLISNNKLKLNRNSDEYYKHHVVLLKDLPLRNTNTAEKHIRECFRWYYDKVRKEFRTGEELAGFVDTMVDKLFFTIVEVTDQVNAFKVFETLNARGVQLSPSDLLKNYLFSVVDATHPHNSEIEELEVLWAGTIGTLGEHKFEEYLRYYWNSETRTVGKKNLFKTIRAQIGTKEQVFSLVRSLKDTADIYVALQNPEDELWKDRPELRETLKELKLFQIRQTNSLFIAAYKNLNIQQFQKIAKTCSIISFRYNVIGGRNPNVQEDVYNSIAVKIHTSRNFNMQDFQQVYVSDVNFENDFSTKELKNTTRNHKIVKYILASIEQYKFRHEISIESDLFTVEHIIPEGANEEWGGLPFDEIRRAVYRIGNLTLLEKKLNREAGMLSYEEKKYFFEKSNCMLTQAIAEQYDSWNEDKVADRQRALAKDAKSIWKIQELEK